MMSCVKLFSFKKQKAKYCLSKGYFDDQNVTKLQNSRNKGQII